MDLLAFIILAAPNPESSAWDAIALPLTILAMGVAAWLANKG